MAGKSSKHAKLRIKKGDEVIVITGKDKGKKGSVLRVVPADRRILVQGVNMVKRHTRPTSAGPGGIIEQEGFVDVSNVMLVDPGTNQPSRFRVEERDGKRVRVFSKSGDVVPEPKA